MFQMNVNKARIDLGLVWGDRALLFFCEILQFLLEEFSIIYSLQTPPPHFLNFLDPPPPSVFVSMMLKLFM